MNKDLKLNHKSSSTSIDLEEPATNSNMPFECNPMYAGLQIKRDNRPTSEKFKDHEIPSIDSLGDLSEGSTQDEIGEEHSNNQLQLLSPIVRSTPRNEALQTESSGLFNLLRGLGTPLINRPTIPQPAASEPRSNPFSYFSSLLSNRLRSPRPQPPLRLPDFPQQTTSEESSSPQPTSQEQSLDNPTDDALSGFPRGALIVRTVHPGPNGSIIIQMRVISMDEIFGRREGAEENSDEPNIEMLSLLLRTLSGASGMEERGLEKEVLDSLPVVTYSDESFKNVDPESKKCAICFDDYEDGQDIRFLWCLHRFHKNCIDHWLDKHTNCPICKKDFSEAEKTYE